ncbi:Exostosin family protein [Hirschfeldia incana]|nr:Exostosin family protein [Hirschfeldia incana]
MSYALPWRWKVESRRLLWLLGFTFALIVTFQYVELPYSLSSLFSSTKIPLSRNSTSLIRDRDDYNSNLTPAMAPSFSQNNATLVDDSSGNGKEVEVDKILDNRGNESAPAAFPPSLPTSNSSPVKENATATAPAASVESPAALPGLKPSPVKDKATVRVPSAKAPAALPVLNLSTVNENATGPVASAGTPPSLPMPSTKKDASPVVRFVSDLQENPKTPDGPGVMSISEMSKKLRQNRISLNRLAKKPEWVTKPDLELLQAKHDIENAPIDDKDPLLYAPLYRNVSIFKRSYEMMEKMLKVYVYKEGDKPIMHTPKLGGIYSSEGWFMKLIESNNKYVTKDATKAHLFYLPFSSQMLEETLYVKNSHSHRNLIKYLKDYIDFISIKYPYWNRTSGADHFLAACHDWAPSETRKHFPSSIRALCNSDVKEGFVFGKDTSLPETYVRDPKKPLSNLGGKSASRRPTLAFFAGQPDHGYVRPILLSYWGNNKDPDLKIFGELPRSKGNKSYLQFMKTSKYCICAKGYEVNSPRVVEAIFYDCVPVIISDNFVPPFFGVLNWESFAVFVLEKDIPNLKKILMSISERRYRQMQMRVKRVRKHFLWHVKPEKYDMFHMILHSVWFNRVFQISV